MLVFNRVRKAAHQGATWLVQDRHVDYLRRAQAVFTTHPHEAGETYLVHFWFTAKMGLKFAYVSFVILMHGLFPFIFTKTASIEVEKLYRVMKSRIPKKRLEELDRERLYSRKTHEGITGDARIAIVGGGFSGVAVFINLIRRAKRPMTVEWFDLGQAPGEGVAYSTRYVTHLLNVPTEKMGAFARHTDGFYHWLKTAKGSTRAARLWPQRDVTADAFVPRMLYGEYLAQLVEEAKATAKEKGIEVNLRRAQVTDARLYNEDAQQILLTSEQGDDTRDMLVDAMVLATGNLPPRKFGFQAGIIGDMQGYVPDIWKAIGDPHFISRVTALPEDAEIVIIGSGLTMVDSVLALSAQGYKGTITAISRSGQLPSVHAPCRDYPQWAWLADPRSAPTRVYGLLHGIRQEVKRAVAKGYDWRSVVDSLRPVTQILWQRLSTAEKRKFLSRLYTLWNTHRHRMAPEIHDSMEALKREGRLRVIAGSIYFVGADREGLSVAYRRRRTNEVESLRPALVLNCSGPEYDIAASEHALLKTMRDRELITVGPLRVGIEISANGSAHGTAPDTLFPVGPLLAGEYLECTAVPELREVASEVADAVLHRVEMIAHEDVQEGLSLGEWI